tara:strand:+ start:1369 stop:3162 length:1794 start_codon:yes stop_codon:yes gene_type:complete
MADEQQNQQNQGNILDRLRGLFQSNIIIRKTDNNQLIVKDIDHSQTSLTSNFIDRYNKMLQSNYGSGYSKMQNASYDVQRIELFKDYELMDNDPILSSALDVYADESTVTNVEGEILEVKSENVKIQEILTNLFNDILNVNFNLWSWIRNLVKYGDFYLQLDILDKHGVINVKPMSPYDVIRLEDHDPANPNLVQFTLQGDTKNLLENYEVAHFRLLSDSNFAPYGKAQIEGARKVFKQLNLMEDAMMIHRIMRAPERRVFKIDIGNIPPNEVDNFMNKIMDKIKKIPVIDQKTGDYNLRYNIHSVTEDFFLPVRGSDSGTSIEPLQGLQNEGAIEDIEYLRNKMMASLRIPKAFLGYEEGVGSKATLAAEDVRFARTIERVQKIVVSELAKIAIVHLYTQGFNDAELLNFELKLNTPSTIHEQEKLELLSNKIDLATSAKEAKLFSNQWIYENIFDFSLDDMKTMMEQVVEDTKQAFRFEQIETEGNDPAESGEAVEGEGGPMPRSGAWGGSKKDLGVDQENHWGRDRLGKNDYKNGKGHNDYPDREFKGGSPLATSKGSTAVRVEQNLLDRLRQRYKINPKSGILNEESLIEDEK